MRTKTYIKNSYKIVVTVERDGRIVNIEKPDFVRFPYHVGEICNMGVEVWARNNGWENKDHPHEKKLYGIPVKYLPPHLAHLKHLAR